MQLNIEGRVALVCGSSSGLGRAIATTLAEEGCRVALNGRDQARLEAALEAVSARTHREVDAFKADVSVRGEAEALVKRVRERFGSVDILVCNAGGPPAGRFDDVSGDNWQAALDLNLLSTIHLCRSAVPIMRRRQWGRIICLTSVAAKQPLTDLILSTTARAGVLGFAKSLADDVASDGITVNAVCPGYMHTERLDELVERRATQEGRDAADVARDLVADIPVGRMGEPAELAAAVAFLASERASYITGVALQVDGGFIRSIV
ncbi:MAG: SDR family oxidoreductase [Gemmatimonadales bacterium]